MASTKSRNGLAYASIGIAVAAIAISLAAAALPQQPVQEPAPQTREFYLLTQVDEGVEVMEDELGIPPDLFFPTQMTVNKGDNVVVHFYNLEPEETQEHHTFTMTSGVYQTHNDLNAGEQKTIEFTASEAGVFDYICTYHTPTMRGQLVVLGQ
ncbi:MAG TPA: cupredoxin domain-containing protein [Nitrososphaera sp.]|jgi:plastocyanin|nr:cupredoxin domain-containing protein [Nitrososphaera sp.]